MRYENLADLYADILKGEIDTEETTMNYTEMKGYSGGLLIIAEHGVDLFECPAAEAIEFVSALFGVSLELVHAEE